MIRSHATRFKNRRITLPGTGIYTEDVLRIPAEADFTFKYTFNQKILPLGIFDTFCVFRCVACDRIASKKEHFVAAKHVKFAVFCVFYAFLPERGVKTYFLSKISTPSGPEASFEEVRSFESCIKAFRACFAKFNTLNQKSLNPVIFDTLGIFEGSSPKAKPLPFSAVFASRPSKPSQNALFRLFRWLKTDKQNMKSRKFPPAARCPAVTPRSTCNARRAAPVKDLGINNTQNQNFSHPEIFDTLAVFSPPRGTPVPGQKHPFASFSPSKRPFFRGKNALSGGSPAKVLIFTKFTPLLKGCRGFAAVRLSDSYIDATRAFMRKFNTFNQKSVNPVIFDTLAIFEGYVFYQSSPAFSAVFEQNTKNPSKNTVFYL
jgi:hypothetical protein